MHDPCEHLPTGRLTGSGVTKPRLRDRRSDGGRDLLGRERSHREQQRERQLSGGRREQVAVEQGGGDRSPETWLDGRGMGEMTVAIVGLTLAFWFCHFLYQRKIFLRL